MKKKTYLQQTYSVPALRKAWAEVRRNGQASKSEETRNEIEQYEVRIETHLNRINKQIRDRRFTFGKSKAVRLPKKKPGERKAKDFRPLVISPVESRIVQRSLLETLTTIPEIQPFIFTPHSFGGIPRRDKNELSAVPGAIQTVLQARQAGCSYARCADISGFFTAIKKSSVLAIIKSAISEDPFIKLLEGAITVELSNMASLREGEVSRFPIADLGVAQGNALSPLLGNILLYEFDRKMNEGDCRCIRYIDDFVVLGPTEKAVNARFRLAERLLSDLGMTLSPGKSHVSVKTFTGGFTFLGVELINGIIRPDNDAINEFKNKINALVSEGRHAFKVGVNQIPGEKLNDFLSILTRMHRLIQGWAKHYKFCNDHQLFAKLDGYVNEKLREYIGGYSEATKATSPRNKRTILGVQLLEDIEWRSLEWNVI
jgi:RNA-directed DNA polymerase